MINCDHSNCGETARCAPEAPLFRIDKRQKAPDFQRETYLLPIATIFHTFVRDVTYLQPNLMVESVTLFRLM
jgi:hypothetical protein